MSAHELRRSTIAVLAAGAGLWLALVFASPVAADDPSTAPAPTPLVFHTPQYLVWMDGHSTYNGPVVDNAYWLYISPDEEGRFVVPDGSGGVYHYAGHTVGGPFSGETDACPAMLAVGVTSLEAWLVAAGEEAQVVDCTRYLATAAPAATVPASGDGSLGGGSTSVPADDAIDPADLGLAIGLLGLLLFGSGTIGVVRGGQPAPVPATTRHEPPPDPCSDEAAAVTRASATGRYLNDLLASCRRYDALLQEQIDVLANLVLPGSVLLDLGFAAGGLSGGLAGPLGRKLIASETFKAAVGEAVVKDVLKEIGKQALGSAGGQLDGGNVAFEGSKSAVKQSLLGALKEAIVNHQFFETAFPMTPQKVFRDLGEYGKFSGELAEYAGEVAGPITEGMGALLDLYEGVSNGLELKARLDQLRALRDRMRDKQAELEIKMEDALSDHRYAQERLSHCQAINAPGWRP